MELSDEVRDSGMEFPNGARFAFTIFDDTDDGTLANLRPIYELLDELGMRATKTVWPFRHEGPSDFFACETLEDDRYREWVRSLQAQGFEVTWHCASFESSGRERTAAGIERFTDVFGSSPRIHANHALNRENLYWGRGRLDMPSLASLLGWATRTDPDYYQGHIQGSPWWWGDLAQRHVLYGRNLTFNDLNVAKVNPSMPYSDPRRSLIPLWFSASDAETVREFNRLTSPGNVDRLEREGGFTIIATHLGKGFVRDGEVNPETRRNLEYVARRPGWFPTAGELLDWLKERRGSLALPRREWAKMQRRFARDLVLRKVRFKWDRRSSSST